MSWGSHEHCLDQGPAAAAAAVTAVPAHRPLVVLHPPLAPNFAMPWTHVVQVREMVLQAREQPEDSRAYGSLENTTLFGVAAQVGMDV